MIEFLIRGLGLGVTYGLLGMPLSLLFIALGGVDFALGSYAVVAASTAFSVGGAFGVTSGVVAAVVAASLFGLFSHVVQKRSSTDAQTIAMASLGYALLLESVVQTFVGTQPFAKQLFATFWNVGGVRVSPQVAVNLAVALAILGVLWSMLFHTSLGRGIRASAVNPKGALLADIAVYAIRFAVFVVAGILAGVAGLLYLFSFGLNYASGMDLTLAAFGSSLLLGIQSPLRAFLGGLIMGVIEALAIAYAPADVVLLIPLLFIFAVLVFGKASRQIERRA